ncbi:MAG: hypothetical protein IPO67_14990 [Deltaproteobacteria bacterium]|nr:hypothetical protein [Deltaproteobacteria bacterium]
MRTATASPTTTTARRRAPRRRRTTKDADGDGYGDKSDTGAAYCDATSTYKVTNKTDCNDSSSADQPRRHGGV